MKCNQFVYGLAKCNNYIKSVAFSIWYFVDFIILCCVVISKTCLKPCVRLIHFGYAFDIYSIVLSLNQRYRMCCQMMNSQFAHNEKPTLNERTTRNEKKITDQSSSTQRSAQNDERHYSHRRDSRPQHTSKQAHDMSWLFNLRWFMY